MARSNDPGSGLIGHDVVHFQSFRPPGWFPTAWMRGGQFRSMDRLSLDLCRTSFYLFSLLFSLDFTVEYSDTHLSVILDWVFEFRLQSIFTQFYT